MDGDRAQQEMEWRRRNSEARERLTEARKRYELLSKLHLTTGSYYVDSNNEPVITSVEQLQSMVAEAQGELDSATAALSQLREDARRAGVPPGWVR
jgi:aspartate/tyrosine/aromatic aminotransferase